VKSKDYNRGFVFGSYLVCFDFVAVGLDSKPDLNNYFFSMIYNLQLFIEGRSFPIGITYCFQELLWVLMHFF